VAKKDSFKLPSHLIDLAPIVNAQELPKQNIRLKEYTDAEIDDLDNKKL